MSFKFIFYIISIAAFSFLLTGCNTDGENGEKGDQGLTGAMSLIRIIEEPNGEHCSLGGQKLQSGVDVNSNSVLDNDEVTSTQYICNPADGLSTLLFISDEVAGENCINGGKRIDSGIDDNQNLVLDQDEIDITEYICNGIEGISTLIHTEALDIGDVNCSNGGFLYQIGLDNNSNDVLEIEEVNSVQYVCNGIDGLTTITDTKALEIGDVQCTNGGFVYKAGLDTNKNTILDPIEVNQTKYVCNGVDGDNGLSTLVQTEVLNVGDVNCSNGGFIYKSGLDDNNNSSLDVEEIDAIQYVCNGVDGSNGLMSLIATEVLLPGDANCSAGGFLYKTGIDINNNLILDSLEVEFEQYICNAERAQTNNLIYTKTSTQLQSRAMLVIRLEFADQVFVSDETVWQSKLFGVANGELNNYYHEISENQFEFHPVIDEANVTNGITTVSFLSNHPDPDLNAVDFESQFHPYLKSAIEAIYSDGSGFNFSNYDVNADQSITPDELLIVFIMAGEEDAYSGGMFGSGIWAHQWCVDKDNIPIVDNNITLFDCEENGNYTVFGERHMDSSIIDHDATIGIMAHELGHSAFNLPDLYYGSGSRIGYYGLMSSGSWGQLNSSGYPGDTPTHMCAWSKIDTGWYSTSSSTKDKNVDVKVNATSTPNFNIIKTPILNSTSEYFLLENRSNTGYDAGLSVINSSYNGGIAIWHIDETVIALNREANTVNSDIYHKGVDLEEAAGDSADIGYGDPSLNLYYSGNINAFTPDTTPNTNSYLGVDSFISFTDISSVSGIMTVRIDNPQ